VGCTYTMGPITTTESQNKIQIRYHTVSKVPLLLALMAYTMRTVPSVATRVPITNASCRTKPVMVSGSS
jgi:hypothetical protein